MSFENYVLPISNQEENIASDITNNEVVVVSSPTGSGKSRRLPFCVANAMLQFTSKNTEKSSAIAETIYLAVPRQLNVEDLSVYFEENWTGSVRKCYHLTNIVREKAVSNTNSHKCPELVICTHGYLTKSSLLQPSSTKKIAIIIDEIHERTTDIDLLITLAKLSLTKKGSVIKIILSSATLAQTFWTEYFKDFKCKCVNIEFPPLHAVRELYNGSGADGDFNRMKDSLCSTITRTCIDMVNKNELTNILVFLPGEQECIHVRKEVIKEIMISENPKTIRDTFDFLLLSSKLQDEFIRDVARTKSSHKKWVAFSTNVAESGITFDDLGVVIDSGLEKCLVYSTKTRQEHLVTIQTSQASATQRIGRVGRTQKGMCIRLYSPQTAAESISFNIPELMRVWSAEWLPQYLYQSSYYFKQQYMILEQTPSLPVMDHLIEGVVYLMLQKVLESSIPEDYTSWRLTEFSKVVINIAAPIRDAISVAKCINHKLDPWTAYAYALIRQHLKMTRFDTNASSYSSSSSLRTINNRAVEFKMRSDNKSTNFSTMKMNNLAIKCGTLTEKYERLRFFFKEKSGANLSMEQIYKVANVLQIEPHSCRMISNILRSTLNHEYKISRNHRTMTRFSIVSKKMLEEYSTWCDDRRRSTHDVFELLPETSLSDHIKLSDIFFQSNTDHYAVALKEIAPDAAEKQTGCSHFSPRVLSLESNCKECLSQEWCQLRFEKNTAIAILNLSPGLYNRKICDFVISATKPTEEHIDNISLAYGYFLDGSRDRMVIPPVDLSNSSPYILHKSFNWKDLDLSSIRYERNHQLKKDKFAELSCAMIQEPQQKNRPPYLENMYSNVLIRRSSKVTLQLQNALQWSQYESYFPIPDIASEPVALHSTSNNSTVVEDNINDILWKINQKISCLQPIYKKEEKKDIQPPHKDKNSIQSTKPSSRALLGSWGHTANPYYDTDPECDNEGFNQHYYGSDDDDFVRPLSPLKPRQKILTSHQQKSPNVACYNDPLIKQHETTLVTQDRTSQIDISFPSRENPGVISIHIETSPSANSDMESENNPDALSTTKPDVPRSIQNEGSPPLIETPANHEDNNGLQLQTPQIVQSKTIHSGTIGDSNNHYNISEDEHATYYQLNIGNDLLISEFILYKAFKIGVASEAKQLPNCLLQLQWPTTQEAADKVISCIESFARTIPLTAHEKHCPGKTKDTGGTHTHADEILRTVVIGWAQRNQIELIANGNKSIESSHVMRVQCRDCMAAGAKAPACINLLNLTKKKLKNEKTSSNLMRVSKFLYEHHHATSEELWLSSIFSNAINLNQINIDSPDFQTNLQNYTGKHNIYMPIASNMILVNWPKSSSDVELFNAELINTCNAIINKCKYESSSESKKASVILAANFFRAWASSHRYQFKEIKAITRNSKVSRQYACRKPNCGSLITIEIGADNCLEVSCFKHLHSHAPLDFSELVPNNIRRQRKNSVKLHDITSLKKQGYNLEEIKVQMCQKLFSIPVPLSTSKTTTPKRKRNQAEEDADIIETSAKQLRTFSPDAFEHRISISMNPATRNDLLSEDGLLTDGIMDKAGELISRTSIIAGNPYYYALPCASIVFDFKNKKYEKTILHVPSAKSPTRAFIFINVNGNHWVVAFSNRMENEILIYNPLGPSQICQSLRKVLLEVLGWSEDEIKRKKGVTHIKTGPVQQDEYSCGVYCILFAIEHILGQGFAIEREEWETRGRNFIFNILVDNSINPKFQALNLI